MAAHARLPTAGGSMRFYVMLALLVAACAPGPQQSYDVVEKSIGELQADLTQGRTTSEQIVQAYLDRIARLDDSGPTLNAVLVVNPNALDDARQLDRERAQGHVRGPLPGIPMLVKDNIETADPMPSTAGSLALAQNLTRRDAFVIARLRAAGAVILGKTNLSEWANIRSSASTSGWSAVGGLTRNPYATDRNTCGSSSGSGAAAAASLAAIAIGTETDGSIVCPSSINGLVGIKPTGGLLSRVGIVPISHTQDTPGPMGRSVADVAATLTAMAATDATDAATREADARREDYSAALRADALRGKRIGVLRFQAGFHRAVDARFGRAIDQVRETGAEIVEIAEEPAGLEHLVAQELTVQLAELKSDLNAYLATAAPTVQPRTLRDLIAFNRATPEEMTLFGQELFEQAEGMGGVDDRAYLAVHDRVRAGARSAIDNMLRDHGVDALIAPTMGPAWATDVLNGDHLVGGSASTLPAVAGYPHVTVPMGEVGGLPVGLSFIGTAWSDARLLAFAYAYEQSAHARRPPH